MTTSPSECHATRPDESAAATASWSGRTLPASGFEHDRGEPDAHLLAALEATAERQTPEREQDLLDAAARARWLVPVVPVDGRVDGEVDGKVDGQVEPVVERSADMAVVTVAGPGGRRGLPVFTGVSALAAWSAGARPVPVSAARAAGAALSEGCEVMLVDLGSAHAVVLRPSMVWALAEQRPWLPGHLDPVVGEGVRRSVTAEDAVRSHTVDAPGPDAGTVQVSLEVRAGLASEQVHDLLARIGERIASDAQVRVRLDGLAFRVTRADGPPAPCGPPAGDAAGEGADEGAGEGLRP